MKVTYLMMSLLVVMCLDAAGQLKVPGLDNFRKVMSDCTIEYKMKCTYPGGQVYDIGGVMAIKGDNFYDSSNLRFVLLNKDWYLIADHMTKELSVAYIKDINQELDGIASVSASSFLFSEDVFSGISEVEVVKQNADTSWMSVKFKDTSIIKELNIQTLRKNLQPVSYSAIINYPIGGFDNGEVVTVILDMNCYNIVTPANIELFDDKRLVSRNGKNIKIKKYNTYKTYN